MNTRSVSKILVPLAFVLACGGASAACVPVLGVVKLQSLPQESCAQVAAAEGGPFYGPCFSVQLNIAGFPAGTGYAGLTAEPIAGLGGAPLMTPVAVLESAALPQVVQRQSIQTARSAVSLGQGAHRTTLYTNDLIVMQMQPAIDGKPAVTEQILISGTNGKGAYADVTGHLMVTGNSIGAPAPLVGRLCQR